MSDRHERQEMSRSGLPSDEELAGKLERLGRRLAYPPTPDLAGAVRRQLGADAGRSRLPWSLSLTLRPALLALAVLALLVAVLALSPSARLAVADRLGLRGLEIGHVPEAPMPEPRPSATPVGARLDLGDRVTLEEARARAGYRVLLPALQDFGAPEVYFSDQPPGGQVALVYPVRAGLPETRETGVGVLLTQFPGDVEPGFVQKGLGPGARVEAVSIEQGSERWAGYWIEGEAHSLVYLDPTGRPRAETLRLAGRTLVWEQDGVTFRLESALDKDEAIRIAGSLR